MPEILFTISEVSVALAGFSALAGIFRRSDDLRVEFRTLFLIETSLLTLVFSLVPHVFIHFGISLTDVWRLSSALLGVAQTVVLVHSHLENHRVTLLDAPLQSPGFLVAVESIIFLSVLAQIANALAWPWPTSFAVYLLGILSLLLSAALIFAASFWIPRKLRRERMLRERQ